MKSVLNIYWKDWSWSWKSNTLATWCKELIHWKRPWFWGRLKVGGEGDDRGWDGWMASLTWWTWVWASSASFWWTEKLVGCSPWCHKESDTTEQLNNNNIRQQAPDSVLFILHWNIRVGQQTRRWVLPFAFHPAAVELQKHSWSSQLDCKEKL